MMATERKWRALRRYALAGLMAIAMLMQPLSAAAGVEYATFSKDSDGGLLWTQPAYVPFKVIGRGLKVPDADKPGTLKASPLVSPKDVFVDGHDHIYVADTGNNRIVEFDEQGGWLRYIAVPESPLNKPQGIFVTPQGDIYVADTGNKRVVRLTPEGKLAQIFARPKSNLIPDSFQYDPVRLVVDKRGFLYIATLGGYQGLLQLDPEGGFQSFFGTNATELSFLDKMKRALYTEIMYANEISKLPGTISSVAVDKDGFMYTTTAGDVSKNQIKKLNIRGQNMLEYDSRKRKRTFGEYNPRDRKFITGQGYAKPQLIDLTVDRNGNITAIDSVYNMFSQYDAGGNLLYFWGGKPADGATQLGLLKTPVAIDSNSRGDLLVLDTTEGIVQWFRQSEFGALVDKANELTLQGRYEESEEPWQEVLRYNAFFTPALLGLAKAAYEKGDYELARQYFYEGGNRKGVSDAYWQIRLEWFQSRFGTFATAVLFGTILLLLLSRLTRGAAWRQAWRNRKRSEHPAIVQFKHVFTIVRHPLDGFSALRYEGKGSYPGAFVMLAVVFASLVFSRLYTGFVFNRTNPESFHAFSLLVEFAALWLGWVVCNYLVGSILQGEGRFRDVFIASSYALMPLALVGVPLALVSNVMTQSEQSIYTDLNAAMWIWVALLFLWKIQALQNYSVGETAINVACTAFAFVMASVLIMTVVGLTGDLKSFVFEIYQEVRLR